MSKDLKRRPYWVKDRVLEQTNWNLKKGPSGKTRTVKYNIWKENSLDVLNCQLEKAEKSSSELENWSIEINQVKKIERRLGKIWTKLKWPVRQYKTI